ncbi:ABC transporter permease [Haloarchaeobius sp. HME9146]|uniref:ABC transporter permease n=1 Tax=Haloarchaeobius sp. HME9146 TaxID=2978732 RepID=UPI0021BF587F|nr:ABC transporter permease [Haloarchaeobius sp. HME9146]MCT9096533.1 ABC transporter permease [Haloarchaeobius sp. HME9146]
MTEAETETETFETIDWDTLDGSVSLLSPRLLAFLAGAALVGAAFLYDYFVLPASKPTIHAVGSRVDLGFFLVTPFTWDFVQTDWLFVLSLWVVLLFAGLPLARSAQVRNRYWRIIRHRPLALASLVYLSLVVVAGFVGPLFWQASINLPHQFQPPAFLWGPARLADPCLGVETADRCYGTLRYPLGTSPYGKNMIPLLFSGAHVAVKVALITGTIIVPVATVVGAVAGYFGGRVDTLLMSYVDVQQTIPAFVAYLVLSYWGRSLFLFVAVFGLLSWGGLARLVRSEAIQCREDAYVLAARSAGTSDLTILAKHVIPNVANAAVVGLTRLIPTIILIEAAISYMDMNDIMILSWGEIAAQGINTFSGQFPYVYWVTLWPVVALALTVVAASILGDAVRDGLDPKNSG